MNIRTVVTGMGVMTPLGHTPDELWQNLLDGKSGVDTVTRFDVSDYPTKIAAEVKDFDPSPWFEHKEIKKFDTFVHYAVAASDMRAMPKSVT